MAHKDIVQNKLHQILSSTSSQSDDDERDPLEEVPLENYQGVASFGRAVYEVEFRACFYTHYGRRWGVIIFGGWEGGDGFAR